VSDSDSQNSDEIIGLNDEVATLNPEISADEIQSANEPRSNNDDTAKDAVIKGLELRNKELEAKLQQF
jgi:hypothetical protein